MNNETWELRNRVRVETLRELSMLAKAGIPLTGETLDEMARECEAATMSLDLLSNAVRPEEDDGYSPDDPKSGGYHDRMATIWDDREKG
jgi:hypothetical protein